MADAKMTNRITLPVIEKKMFFNRFTYNSIIIVNHKLQANIRNEFNIGIIIKPQKSFFIRRDSKLTLVLFWFGAILPNSSGFFRSVSASRSLFTFGFWFTNYHCNVKTRLFSFSNGKKFTFFTHFQ